MHQKRSLNTWDAIALTVGAMIGAGIFSILSLTVRTAGPSAVLSWVLVVVFSLPMVFTFSDLTGVLSESGGPYVYLRKQTKPWIGLWVGWSFFLSSIGAAAALFIALIGMLRELQVGHAYEIGLVILAVLTLVTALGVHVGAQVQRLLTLTTVCLLVLCIVVGLFHMQPSLLRGGVATSKGTHGFAPHGWYMVLPATFYAFWTYSGWEAVATPSGSYGSRRDLAKGMIAGSFLVGILYIFVAFATVISIPTAEIASHMNPLVLVAALWSPAVASLIGWGAVVIVIGSLLSWLLSSAAIMQALSRDGLFPSPSFVRHAHGEYHPLTPVLAALFLALCAKLPVFSVMIAASSMTALLAYAVVFAAVAMHTGSSWQGVIRSERLRRRMAWGSLLMSMCLVVFSGWNNLWPTLACLAVGGLLIFIRRTPIRKREDDARGESCRASSKNHLPKPNRV